MASTINYLFRNDAVWSPPSRCPADGAQCTNCHFWLACSAIVWHHMFCCGPCCCEYNYYCVTWCVGLHSALVKHFHVAFVFLSTDVMSMPYLLSCVSVACVRYWLCLMISMWTSCFISWCSESLYSMVSFNYHSIHKYYNTLCIVLYAVVYVMNLSALG